jgi:nucleotide-binding universal stress UspA family protein
MTMANIYKILVAVDLSRYAYPLIDYACQLTRTFDAELLLATVIDQRMVDALKMLIKKHSGPAVEVFVQDKERNNAEQLQGLVKDSGCDDLSYRLFVRTGVPFKSILSIIDEEDPDLLIMGTKGRTNLSDVVIGSCAEKLFRRCPIPVLTLPAGYLVN